MDGDRTTTGAEVLLRTLESAGVRYVFTCPGTTEVPVLDASIGHPSVELLLTLHESVAVSMADGYARASGLPGVAYLHTNVGLTNGLAHLYAAYIAGSPVLLLNGVKPLPTLGRRGFTSTPYIRDLARPYCKCDWMSVRADLIAEDILRALRAATARPTGPAYLALPQDLLSAPDSAPAPAGLAVGPSATSCPDGTSIDAAAALLATASRPLLVAGRDVARCGAQELTAQLAETLHAPLLAQARRDIEETSCATGHPNYCGQYDPAAAAAMAADVVFWIGSPTPLEFEPGGAPQVPVSAALVHLCSDAGELGRVHPARVPLIGDTRLALESLLGALSRGTSGQPAERERFLAACRARHATRLAELENAAMAEREHGSLTARCALAVLRDHLTAGVTIVADAVTSGQAVLDFVPRRAAGDFFATASGSLGWGAGAALGVALAQPRRHIVAVLGDGVFQFGIQALWTAVRYRLPVTFLVLDNTAYAAVRLGLDRFGGRAAASGTYPLTDISGPDIAGLARGYGVAGYTATDPEQLGKALAVALGTPEPAVVDARLVGGRPPGTSRPR